MKKSYSSYAEIDKQLEILKIEREIRLLKIIESSEHITNQFTTGNLFKLGISSLGSSIGQSKQFKVFIFTTILKFFVRRLFKRK